MGLVALLILVDILVLGTWGLADPIKCVRSVGAVVKVPSKGQFVKEPRSCYLPLGILLNEMYDVYVCSNTMSLHWFRWWRRTCLTLCPSWTPAHPSTQISGPFSSMSSRWATSLSQSHKASSRLRKQAL